MHLMAKVIKSEMNLMTLSIKKVNVKAEVLPCQFLINGVLVKDENIEITMPSAKVSANPANENRTYTASAVRNSPCPPCLSVPIPKIPVVYGVSTNWKTQDEENAPN